MAHPYYYLAVLAYIIKKVASDRRTVDEFFSNLKQAFLDFDKNFHPPHVVLLYSPRIR